MPATQFHPFRPRLIDALRGYDRARFSADLAAGLTVGVVALPLAMAFAIASGLEPGAGLVAAILGGLLISALGGSQVQIGGPAGAFIVIVYGIVEKHGLSGLLVSTMAAGVLLFAMGLFKLGALVRYVPVSIVIGFTNGIAVLIALSQLKDLLGLTVGKLPADFFSMLAALGAALPTLNLHALALGATSFFGLFLWTRLWASRGGGSAPDRLAEAATAWLPTRAQHLGARIPGPLVALVSLTLVAAVLALPVETIGSRFGTIPNTLPMPAWPPIDWLALKQLVMPTLTIAVLGAIESLLCARVADNAAAFARHDPNQELMAQGVANAVVPLFGGLPVTGTIARTLTNVRAGATSPVSGIVHAITLLVVMLAAAPLALHVPLAVLAGILLHVAWNMGEWREFARLRQFNLPYRVILVGTFVLTVVFDLTVAVEVGLVLACVFFIYRTSQLFRAEPVAPAGLPGGVVVFELFGSLFFGAVGKIEALTGLVPAGTRVVVLEMHRLTLLDTSGLDALEQLHRQLERQGAALVFADVNEQPRSLMQRSGFDQRLGPQGIVPTLDEALAAAARR